VPSAIRSARGTTLAATRGAAPPLRVLRRLKSEAVIDALGQKIVSGLLRPGELLPTEAELSLGLGLSRPSLREALRSLAGKGLVAD